VVVIARMLQSFSVGGEYGAATALLIEQNPQQRGFLRELAIHQQAMTTVLATGFAIGLNNALTPAQLEAWDGAFHSYSDLLLGPVAGISGASSARRRRLRQYGQSDGRSATCSPLIIATCALRGVIVVSATTVYMILFIANSHQTTGIVAVGRVPRWTALRDDWCYVDSARWLAGPTASAHHPCAGRVHCGPVAHLSHVRMDGGSARNCRLCWS